MVGRQPQGPAPEEEVRDEAPRITTLDLGAISFTRALAKLAPDIRREVNQALIDLATTYPFPARLKFHPLKGKSANIGEQTFKVYTIHVTRNDAYKASFTVHGQTARMRHIDTHDALDKRP